MYNIKQAAARAGVTVPVLRAWERRYGIVSPERTASNYRRFDEPAIARVRTMRSLVEQGWSPSAAAAAILAGDVPVTDTAGPDPAAAHEDRDDLAVPQLADELADGFVAGARDLDAGALELVLDDLFSHGSFERTADDLLFPALERLGDAWANGQVSVAGEHLASGAVLRRLALALDAAARIAQGRPRIVVGLPPGARHELGALAFAVAARRAGLAVDYVGADLPVPDWVTAARAADAAVIGIVTARDRRSALDVARALLAARPDLVVAFGGDAAPEEPGVIRLDGDLPTSVATLAGALEQRATA